MTYSLHDLDDKLLKYLNFENGFFIEAGANDGLSQSNTALYEFEYMEERDYTVIDQLSINDSLFAKK
jgi:hypothetical protein